MLKQTQNNFKPNQRVVIGNTESDYDGLICHVVGVATRTIPDTYIIRLPEGRLTPDGFDTLVMTEVCLSSDVQ